MTESEAIAALIDALEAAGVPYMVVGSLSSNFYGLPRATQDADVVAVLDRQALGDLLQRLGPRFRMDPQASFETVTATRRYLIRPVESPFQIEIFLLSDDVHDQRRFRRRRRVELLGLQTWLPTPEDVVITKLRWSQSGRRGKDVADVRNVVAVQSDRLDWPYLETWCRAHGTWELLEEIRRRVVP